MPKALKIFAGLALTGVVLVVGGLAALRVFFPPAKLKAMALDKLQASLGRPVELNGDAALEWSGIRLEELNLPDDGKSDLARASFKSLRARPVWRALIFKQELEIASVGLSGGRAEYSDRKAGAKAPSYRLEDLVVSASAVRLDRAFPLNAAFTLHLKEGETLRKLGLDFAGTVEAAGGDLERAVVNIEALSLTYRELVAVISGRVSNLAAPAVDLKLTLPELKAGSAPELAAMPAWLVLPKTQGTLKAKVLADGADLEGLDLQGQGLALSLSALQTKTGVNLRKADLGWGDIQLKAAGSVSLPADAKAAKALNLTVKTNDIDLAKLPKELLTGAPQGLAGTASLDAKVTGTDAAPVIAGKAVLAGLAAEQDGQKLSQTGGTITLSPSRVDGGLKGKLNGYDFDLSLDARGYDGPKPDVRVKGRLAALDLNTLPSTPEKKPGETAPAAEAPKEGAPAKKAAAQSISSSGELLVGKILHKNFSASTTTMKWDLTGYTPDFKSLGGKINFSIGAGKFEDLRLLVEGKPLAKLVLLPILILQRTAGKVKVLPAFDKINFNEIMGDYALERGIVTVKKSQVDSTIAFVTLTGKADLPADKLDLYINTKLLGALGGTVSAPVGFKVTGTTAEPSVKIDAASVLKQPQVEKAVQKGAELLKGLFK